MMLGEKGLDQYWRRSLVELQCTNALNKQTIYYRKVSNIRRTKYQNLNVSRLGFQLSLCNILKPIVKWRMKM